VYALESGRKYITMLCMVCVSVRVANGTKCIGFHAIYFSLILTSFIGIGSDTISIILCAVSILSHFRDAWV
jgi:hypothetical protein